MLPEKFETKVVENSGIQKQFKIKKLFDKAELVINCGMQDKKENSFSAGS
jgi:DNA topoisomerase-3